MAFTTNPAFTKENSMIGIILTALLIGTGLYIGYKNYKDRAFWLGVIAFFLVGSSIYISKD